MIRQFRLFNDVHDVPMEWNILGMRVPSLAVLLIAIDAGVYLLAAEILKHTLLTDTPVYAYVYPGIPAFLIAFIVVVIIYRVSRTSSLPAKVQLGLMRDYAKQPYVLRLAYDPD